MQAATMQAAIMRGATTDRSFYRLMSATFLRLGAAVAAVGLALGVGLGVTCSSAAAQGDLLNGSGSFESGNINPPIEGHGSMWTPAIDTTQFHAGTHSAKVVRSISNSGNGYVSTRMDFTQGVGYLASVWLRGDSTSAGKPYNMVLEFPDGSRATGASVNAGNGTWVQLNVKGTPPTSGTGTMYITDDPQASPSASQTIWLDDIIVYGPIPDALWAISSDLSSISVCQNPTDQASISGCFGAASKIQVGSQGGVALPPPVTDGTNVYFGNFSCPVTDYGQNCTQIAISGGGFIPNRYAAADGYLWLGAANSGSTSKYGAAIWRCPSNLPATATNGTSMPAECELFDVPIMDNQLQVWGLVYANRKLYVAVNTENGAGHSYLFSCDPYQANTCTQLDMFADYVPKVNGDSCYESIADLAVADGYVWVALDHLCDNNKQKIQRCDPTVSQSCQTWDTPGNHLSWLAADGQGQLWAAVSNDSSKDGDVVWSCSMASTDSCANVITNVNATYVTAGAGYGFSSIKTDSSGLPITYGATRYPQSTAFAGGVNGPPLILYVPGGGAVGLGGVKVTVIPPAAKVARVCSSQRTLPATIHVKGPHKLHITRHLDLCAGRSRGRRLRRHFDLLTPGTYAVQVRSSKFTGSAVWVVTENSTGQIAVRLSARRR